MLASTEGIRAGGVIEEAWHAGTPDEGREADPFGRLVRLMKTNERLFADLKALDAKVGQAKSYLLAPDSHLPLALANLARLKSKHSGLLALLRANRIEALDALDEAGAPRI